MNKTDRVTGIYKITLHASKILREPTWHITMANLVLPRVYVGHTRTCKIQYPRDLFLPRITNNPDSMDIWTFQEDVSVDLF